MASESSSHMLNRNNGRRECVITHKTGKQFTVYLTDYEIQRYQQDTRFAQELNEKYYALLSRGLVTAQSVEEDLHSQSSDDEPNTEPREEQRNIITADVEEQLITLVAQRPPLFDFRLPLAERSRAVVRTLWEEVIVELEGIEYYSVEAISKKWKNMRDSYIRARANINKKLRSGSSAEDKRIVYRLKAKHRHYDAMTFLEDTLTRRPTSSNLVAEVDIHDAPLDTPSTSRSRCESSGSTSRDSTEVAGNTNITEQAFLDAIKQISNTTSSLSDTYHFCMRLAAGLERLPRRIKNQLEIEFFQKVVEAEALYCNETT